MVDHREYPRDHVQLIGREIEQRTLQQVYQSTRSGSGRTVLIGGEAGIGKTSLVESFGREAQADGAVVLSGACYDVTRTPAYGPWIEAVDAGQATGLSLTDVDLWFDDERLNSFADQNAFFREIRDRLTADAVDSPVVIVLEDLHWSDQESLDLLRYLSRSLHTGSVMLVGTYRDDELMVHRPLYGMMPDLVRESQPVRLDPRRFDIELVAELIDRKYGMDPQSRDRLASGLQRRTDGNPFFVSEMLRALELSGALKQVNGAWVLGSFTDVGVPSLLRQVIDRRVQRLDEVARTALQTAAVIGYEPHTDVWLSMTGLSREELSRIVHDALEKGLLEESRRTGQLRFRHALVRETLYDSQALPMRQFRHRETAETIADQGGADPATVASHFHLAADPRAPAWQLKAARQARQHHAASSVVEHLNSALAAESALSSEERMDAHRLRGWAHEVSGNFGAARDDYQKELHLAGEADHTEAEWDALIRLGELWAGRDYDRAGEYIRQALEIARETGDQALIGHSLNRLGNWHMNRENPLLAHDHHDQALAIFSELGDQPGIAATYDLLGMTCVLGGNLVDGAGHYQRAIDLFQSLDDRQGLSSSQANVTHDGASYMTETMVATHRTLDECNAMAERAFAVASEINYRAGEAFAMIRQVACLGPRGRYQRALDALQHAIAISEEIDHRQWLSASNSVAGWLYLDLLDPDTARAHLLRAKAIAEEIGSSHWIRCNSAVLASANLAIGDYDAAESELRRIWSDNLPSRTMAQRQVWCARIEQELHRQHPEQALRFVDSMLDDSPCYSPDRPPVRLAVLKAQALIESGQIDKAGEWLDAARSICQAKEASSWLWRIHRLLGITHQRSGRRPTAAGHFSEARRIIDELARTIDDTEYRMRFQSRALAGIPESWSPTELQAAKGSAGGLTRRQREVAALIATGCSNREIAEHMTISERTVESHVTSILSTLGVDSRAQVAAWAMNQGLVSGSSTESDY